MKTNEDIRARAKRRGVKLWEIANGLGINDGNFSRKLRNEFSEEEKQKVFKIIDEIAAQKAALSN